MLGHILLSIHPRENLELKLLELESTKYMFCLSWYMKLTGLHFQEWYITFVSFKYCVSGLRRQSIAKLHNLSIEAPITKVIALITSVQENANTEDIQTLDKVLTF
jgi:hypothetical protein